MRDRTGKTLAITLRTLEVTNTSAIVVWLTRNHGRLATMIKGAYRPKSLFLGQFDLFYTCELVYYLHAREHLHAIRECYPLKLRARFREDWRACALASYLCDLLARATPWGAPHADLYDLLDRQLDDLATRGVHLEALLQFELKLLAMLGVAPRLNACVACGRVSASVDDRTFFSNERGGIVCARCARAERSGEVAISNGALAIMRNWQRADDSVAGRRTQANAVQVSEIVPLLGAFLSHQIESDLSSRTTALNIVGAIDKRPGS